jgi:hypothetical protein
MPAWVDDREDILKLDSNFECGNIDSAFIQKIYEYNFMMKVDANTKGNCYWFMFRAKNFKAGQRYTFKILNFTRNMEKFYKMGMEIMMRKEAVDPENDSNSLSSDSDGGEKIKKAKWRPKGCSNIIFEPSLINRPEVSSNLYYQL